MIKTIEDIKEKLEFAAEIMRRLPPVKVQGYICSWPNFVRKEDEIKGTSDIWLHPLPEEITAMENILEWLRFVPLEERRLIWLRACGMGWKHLAKYCKKSRTTLDRHYNGGLNKILAALTEKKL